MTAVRLTTGGELDPEFSGSGIFRTAPGANSALTSMKVGGAGSITAAGFVSSGPQSADFSVLRLTPSGVPDNGFGGGSNPVAINLGAVDQAEALELDAAGGVIASGHAVSGQKGDFALARLNPDGSRDNTFGGGGMTELGLGDATTGGAVAPAEGGGYYVGSTVDGQVAVSRFTNAGAPDESFGYAGTVQTDIGGYIADASGITTDAFGSVLLAATVVRPNGEQSVAVVRYLETGALDPSFGAGGIVLFDGTSEAALIATGSMISEPGGGVTLAATALPAGGDDTELGLLQLDASGEPAAGFGEDGVTLLETVGPDGANFVAAQGDSYLVGGTTIGYAPGPVPQMIVARVGSAGGLDTNFGSGGFAIAAASSVAEGIAQTDSGAILLGGYSLPPQAATQFAVAAFDQNGDVDPGFGNSGMVTTGFGNDVRAFGIAVDRNGAIDLAGFSDAAGKDIALARYLPSGALDTNFGSGGVAIYDAGGNEVVSDLIASGEDLVVVGSSDNEYEQQAMLTRFHGSDPPPEPIIPTPKPVIPQPEPIEPLPQPLEPLPQPIIPTPDPIDPQPEPLDPSAQDIQPPATPLGPPDPDSLPINPADSIECRGDRVTIFAHAGTTTRGTPRADVILGTEGDDEILSGRGDDLICAESGDDEVVAGGGKDSVDTERGDDVVRGNGGGDLISGGEGDDALFGLRGRDRLYGRGGNDLLGGEADDDLLDGGAGRNEARGGQGLNICLQALIRFNCQLGEEAR